MPGSSGSWLGRQVAEIAGDRVLRLYGVALAYANVVTFVNWYGKRDVARIVTDTSDPICWPFWESCHAWRVFTEAQVNGLLWVYLGLSLAAGAFFLSRRTVRWGYVGLVVVTAIRLAILAQDFTLRLNQHYMANWATLAFLFFPYRRQVVPALLVSFYWWAGVLKLDMEWLSGAALYNRDKLWMPEALVPASCVYVVVLETVLIFGVYARRDWIFWATVAQLFLFHVWSWPIVGFYYPMLMFGLCSIFPVARLLDGEQGRLDPAALVRPHVLRPAALLLSGFILTQLLPKAFPGDSAITGEGRLLALNMFDARVSCQGWADARMSDGRTKRIPLSNREYAIRIKCDPILYLNLARNECRRPRKGAQLVDFDLHLRSKRATDAEYRDVVDIRNFCTSRVSYDMWRTNEWIRK